MTTSEDATAQAVDRKPTGLCDLPKELFDEIVLLSPAKSLAMLRCTSKDLRDRMHVSAPLVHKREVRRLRRATKPISYEGLSILEAVRLYVARCGGLSPVDYYEHCLRFARGYTEAIKNDSDSDFAFYITLTEALLFWNDVRHCRQRLYSARPEWISEMLAGDNDSLSAFLKKLAFPETVLSKADWSKMLIEVGNAPFEPTKPDTPSDRSTDTDEDAFWNSAGCPTSGGAQTGQSKKGRKQALRQLGAPVPGEEFRYSPNTEASNLVGWRTLHFGKEDLDDTIDEVANVLCQTAVLEELEIVKSSRRYDRL